jgi:hypothetical protein
MKHHPLVFVVALYPFVLGGAIAISPRSNQPPSIQQKTVAPIAWGETKNGLQGGIRFHEDKRRYDVGDQVWLDYLVRNVTNAPVTVAWKTGSVYLDPPSEIKSATGKAARVIGGNSQIVNDFQQTLAPGEEVLIGHPNFVTFPKVERYQFPMDVYPSIYADPGDYAIKQSFPVSVGGKEITLKSGDLKFEFLKPDVPAVWGEPKDGLQLGLAFERGKGSYAMGDTVAVQLLLRNQTNKERPVSYLYNGDPVDPVIQDAVGRRLSPSQVRMTLLPHSRSLTIKPGQTHMLDTIEFKLAANDTDKAELRQALLKCEPGKYSVKVERISDYFEPGTTKMSGGDWKSGKLEFTVTP